MFEELLNELTYLSIVLSILSVVLACIAIFQAWFYKKMQDRQIKEQEKFTRELRINLSYSFIMNRILYRELSSKGLLLRKDCVLVYTTSQYKPSKLSYNIEEIKKQLSRVMKKCYWGHIIEHLKTDDVKIDEMLCEVKLRNEIGLEELKELISVNEELEKYGLYLSLLVKTQG